MLIQREGPFADTLRERAHRGSFEDFLFFNLKIKKPQIMFLICLQLTIGGVQKMLDLLVG